MDLMALEREEDRLLEEEEELAAEELSVEGLNRRARSAARDGRPWELKDCLELGADPRARAWDGALSLLSLAARSRSAASVRMIQERLKALGAPSCSKEALAEATPGWPGSAEVIEALLAGNATDAAPLSAQELGVSRMVELAIDCSASDSVEALGKGAPQTLATLMRGGLTPLGLAAGRDEAECVKALLRAGADPLAKDEGGSTALMVAAAMSEKCLELLLPVSDPLERDHSGMSALMAACCMMTHSGRGNPGCVRRLASVSDVSAKDKDGRTALIWALKVGSGECADALGPVEGELSLPGEEAEAIEALRRMGHGDWAARVERERLERETPGSAPKAKARL